MYGCSDDDDDDGAALGNGRFLSTGCAPRAVLDGRGATVGVGDAGSSIAESAASAMGVGLAVVAVSAARDGLVGAVARTDGVGSDSRSP